MSRHVTLSPNEAADRLAIRELVERYAHCADRRYAKGQMSLFTADTHFVVYLKAKDPTPSQEVHGLGSFRDRPTNGQPWRLEVLQYFVTHSSTRPESA